MEDAEYNFIKEMHEDLMLYGFYVMQNTPTGAKRIDPRDVIIGLKDQVVELD